jgi:hypothetical protein
MELAARLIGEAWEHRRQRRRTLGAGLVVVVLAAAVVVGVLIGRWQSQPGVAGYPSEPSSSVVAQTFSSLTPDGELGDHCAILNSVACDTAAFDVQLKRAAISVVASMGSRVMKLEPIPRGDGFPAPGEITAAGSAPWTGFFGDLQPSGTPNIVRHQTRAPLERNQGGTHLSIRLLITYADGGRVTTSVRSEPIRAYAG